MQAVVIDLTRAWTGTEEGLLHSIVGDENVIGDGTPYVICSEQQQGRIRVPDGATVLSVPGGSTASREVIGMLTALARTVLKDQVLTVYSFHDAVRPVVEVDLHGEFRHLKGHSPASRAVAPVIWPEHIVPRAEAMAVLLQVVADAGSDGLLTTNVRPRMTRVDGRFAKTYTREMSAPNLISSLIASARAEELLSADEAIPNNHRLRITAAGQAKLGRPAQRASLPGRDDGFVPKTRSQEIIDILRRADLGPFLETRHALYDAFEAELARETDNTLGALIRRGVTRVRQNPPSALVERGAVEKYPWQRLQRLFELLQQRQPVARGEGETLLRPNFTESRAKVIALVPDWRKRLDGELIVELVQLGAALSYHDLPDITGALLGDRSDDNINFISDTLAMLIDDGRLVEDGGDHLKLLPAPASDPLSSPPPAR